MALPARTREALNWWHEESPFRSSDALVFFGDAAQHPLNAKTLQKILARALDGFGVAKGDRYLTTHSLRHTYNTMIRRSIPADALLALMGHRDSGMSDLYDHPEIADRIKALEGVRGQIESALTW